MNQNNQSLNSALGLSKNSVLETEMYEKVEAPKQTMARLLNTMFNIPKLPEKTILAIHRKGVFYDKIFFHEPIDMLEALIANDPTIKERIERLGYTIIRIHSNQETKFRTIWPIQQPDKIHPNLL